MPHLARSAAESAIVFAEATIAYSRSVALEWVSFSIGHGEFIGIIGPNGSGKTTLLRAVLGLVLPSSGQVVVLGRSGRQIASVRSRIGYVPQRRQLDPGFPLTVFDVALTGCYGQLGIGRRPGASHRQRAAAALAAVGLGELHDHVAGHLSGGQQQRLLIARALVSDPELLLLDEPTAAVDVATRQEIVELVRSLHQQRRLTTLYVTHDVNEVLPCVDKVLYLNRRLVAFGTCEAVLNRQMLENLYGGKVLFVEEDGRRYVLVGDKHA